MAQRSPAYRSSSVARPTAEPRRRRVGRLRRSLFRLLILGVLLVIAVSYALRVYAPGLRDEARTVPALVRGQLTTQGASYVPLSEIAPSMGQAIVAIEDRRFYEHPGIDPLGTARAAWVDLTTKNVDQGGSTLEQQLAKRTIVHDDTSLHAKLRTMAIAWAIDQEFSKRQILELYLNAAYYGQGAYGINAAAHTYFGTDPAHLTLAESAFLAALPQAPSVYGANPRSVTVVARMNTVLHDMEAMGTISPAQEQVAQNTPLTFALPNL
ncbi:MAG TPA: biosynthetic peptidoglycan transglycosylase [Chloroflexota bacterium]